ncbi:MAG TPA: Uma2 family endonuclease [Polyangiaceae bacterium]|nr:Uma2 family endonuclease [Polyangiaceae bacterium]
MVTLPIVSLRYCVGADPEAWVIPEGPVPESTAHDAALLRIFSLLAAWAARTGNGARIARNLAVRWLPEHPRTGIDPDVSVLLPAPSDFDELSSLRLWESGRQPPLLAIEVVSESHPYKDYVSIQERYAAMRVPELLVYDPLLVGPKALGGPVALQLWRREPTGLFERVHFGSEPAYSTVLDAWFMAEGRTFHIADDRAGTRLWLTEADELAVKLAASQVEADRAKVEADRAKVETERAKATALREEQLRFALEQKVRELEAERARR